MRARGRYKKVYSANPITVLAHTQVWKKQRAFREKRAEKIADHKLKSGVNGWPGTNPSTFAIGSFSVAALTAPFP